MKMKPNSQSILALCVSVACLSLASCQSGAVTLKTDASSGGQGTKRDSGLSLHPEDGTAASLDASSELDLPDANDDAPEAVCGDGILQAGEGCDDGNARPGDGCSGVCAIEPGSKCPTPGQACVLAVVQVCGDGIIEGSEACDDGNLSVGDGCSSGCAVEYGWGCATPGQPCTRTTNASVCGNAVVESGEQCDDGNLSAGDGCSALCQLESSLWTCPNPGKPCVAVAYCGDGVVQSDRGEQCDDGNSKPGDGCSGVCALESGYTCPTQGQLCVKAWVCENGVIDPGEACDDGNTAANDGCSADCSTVEPGYTCPKGTNNTGGPCTKAPANVCGNGIIGTGEGCDDGNTVSDDGCSSTCVPEDGWNCPEAGKACMRIEYCSDSVVSLDISEQCDDGNTVGGDGCSPACTIEPDYVCPTAGMPCVSTVKCGDSKISGNEQCDDGNAVSRDGCSATCQLEAGWTCPIVGAACSAAACGDGIVAGTEQCDDGNTNLNDGCSSSCQLESGYACGPNTWHPNAASTECYRTVCGDGHKEGTEQCDDGNVKPFDGCSPSCANEPKCGYPNNDTSQAYKCFSVCGDGIKMSDEACDDGNLQDGDGCSSTCTVENGFECDATAAQLGDTLTIPVLYRDFNWRHPQFEVDPSPYNQRLAGIAASAVGVDSKPVFNSSYLGGDGTRAWTMDGPAMNTSGTQMTDAAGANFRTKGSGNTKSLTSAQAIADRYGEWFTDDPNATGDATADAANSSVKRITIQSTLTLDRKSAGTYQYYNSAFFPLDGLGYGNITDPDIDEKHNFGFTSEIHYWFQYNGGEKLSFRGDDDVWVFVNGKLAVDLGGIHSELSGVVTLNGASTQVCVDEAPPSCADQTSCSTATCTTVSNGFNLVVGDVYEIIVFQAERHVTGSNYKLTLSGFNAPKSVCHSVCGDGIVTRGEACDLGSSKNTGAYGTCNADCTLPPRCGDKVVQTSEEQCDDGVNQTTYGGTSKTCGPSCSWAPYCGDGVVSNGEQCDEGSANGSGYGHCTSACTNGPRCGDGTVNGSEQCDDGIANGTSTSGCTESCTLKCGNGTVDPGEACDNGANNTGGYGKCNADCSLGPYCGDGIPNGSEQCDDGKNDGTYGTCSPGCVLAAYCGDGSVNGSEQCDSGSANSASAYGVGLCTNQCTPAPYCGDKRVDGQAGEACDDGVNSGAPGSCAKDCSAYVPSAACGDGTVASPEQCDDGANNGTAQSTCDAHCKLKCGNGVKDSDEQCDNGVNDGSYGTCNPDCTLPAYCGDGVLNGSEQCDFGTANVSASGAYGSGICTSTCTWAGYCGDGRVQSQSGEECDGGSNCNASCKKISVWVP